MSLGDFTHLLSRLEAILPPANQQPDWSALAFRWRRKMVFGTSMGWLEAVANPHRIRFADLQNVEAQRDEVARNTRQFVAGRTANNVLLTGARGTGKSSLIKAAWDAHVDAGLRLVEVEKDHLVDLAEIVSLLAPRPEKFIIFCDDLSFDEGESGYKALKSVLDGSIAATSSNILIYASSNRRHLVPEYFDENIRAKHIDGEIRPADTVEEKISLSERFGLCLTFYPFNQNEYLAAVQHWLREFDVTAWDDSVERASLNFALQRGSRSGRVAWQFARDWAGRA